MFTHFFLIPLQVGNNLRTMEISEDAANQRETTYIDSIKKLGEDYEAAAARAAQFEAQAEELEQQQEQLDEELEKEKAKYEEAKRTMEAVLSEISEMNA